MQWCNQHSAGLLHSEIVGETFITWVLYDLRVDNYRWIYNKIRQSNSTEVNAMIKLSQASSSSLVSKECHNNIGTYNEWEITLYNTEAAAAEKIHCVQLKLQLQNGTSLYIQKASAEVTLSTSAGYENKIRANLIAKKM